MSKLPLETRPIRLGAGIMQAVEELLRPLTGKTLKTAQDAVLEVYHSGKQMQHSEWIAAYKEAIAEAVQKERQAA